MIAKEKYKHLIEIARNRILPDSVYTEQHHILPRSMGGTDKKVKLTLKEHFIAHKLLEEMTRGTLFHQKMNLAIHFMSASKDPNHKIVTPEEYENYRLNMIKYMNSDAYKEWVLSDDYKKRVTEPAQAALKKLWASPKGKILLAEKSKKHQKLGTYKGNNSKSYIIFDPYENRVYHKKCLQFFCNENPYIKVSNIKRKYTDGCGNFHLYNRKHYKAFRAVLFKKWKAWTSEERKAWVFESREIRKQVFNRIYKICVVGKYIFKIEDFKKKFDSYVWQGIRNTLYKKRPWFGMLAYKPFDYDNNIDITKIPDFESFHPDDIASEVYRLITIKRPSEYIVSKKDVLN